MFGSVSETTRRQLDLVYPGKKCVPLGPDRRRFEQNQRSKLGFQSDWVCGTELVAGPEPPAGPGWTPQEEVETLWV